MIEYRNCWPFIIFAPYSSIRKREFAKTVWGRKGQEERQESIGIFPRKSLGIWLISLPQSTSDFPPLFLFFAQVCFHSQRRSGVPTPRNTDTSQTRVPATPVSTRTRPRGTEVSREPWHGTKSSSVPPPAGLRPLPDNTLLEEVIVVWNRARFNEWSACERFPCKCHFHFSSSLFLFFISETPICTLVLLHVLTSFRGSPEETFL